MSVIADAYIDPVLARSLDRFGNMSSILLRNPGETAGVGVTPTAHPAHQLIS